MSLIDSPLLFIGVFMLLVALLHATLFIQRIRQLACCFALDDFGSGMPPSVGY